ncbi:tetratricopeptide repeat protein [Duganella sp. FT80W]|uniref:Tetratricopeptide repeat protein n=1 Tax=Duganella guangzhouensis TaxID=2666084 RepID=A0A6I2KW42_9BURK|nr:tetratricopeptide repeat protein [Duganella guangzhouensis]MRW89983.1 tetratricopeptide repeat protein [Duganella guangzhouensis]
MIKHTLSMAMLMAASSFAHALSPTQPACGATVSRSWEQLEQDLALARTKDPLAAAEVLHVQSVRKAATREATYAAELAGQANDLWRAAPATAELAATLQQHAQQMGMSTCALTVPLLRTALAISEKAVGADDARTIGVLADLVRADIGRRDDTALAQDGARLMAAWAAHGDPADAQAAPVYRKMIEYYYRQQQYAQAEPLALRNLKNGEQAHGKEAAALVERLDDLAVIYYGQLRYSEGAALSQRAKAIAVKAAPDSLRAMGGRQKDVEAEMRKLFSNGDVRGAITRGEQELKSLEQTSNNYAAALQKALREREAATSASQMEQLSAVADRARSTAEASEKQLAAMRVRVAELYHHQRRYDLAEPLYQQALLNYTQAQADALELAPVKSDLAMLYRARADNERAASLQAQALEVLLPAYGPDHPDVIDSARELVLLYQRLGNPEAMAGVTARVPTAAATRAN